MDLLHSAMYTFGSIWSPFLGVESSFGDAVCVEWK